MPSGDWGMDRCLMGVAQEHYESLSVFDPELGDP